MKLIEKAMEMEPDLPKTRIIMAWCPKDFGLESNRLICVNTDARDVGTGNIRRLKMNKVSESIFDGATTIIPMADVQHIEKEEWGGTELIGQAISTGPKRIRYTVITKHTVKKNGKWLNPIILPHHEGKAFLEAWCHYRYELEGGKDAIKLTEVNESAGD